MQSKGTVTVITETVTVEEPNKEVDDVKPKDKKEERGTFKGSDTSRPYKTPEFEGISLATDVREDDNVKPKTTVTKTVTETISPREEEKGRFQGADISKPYKSPDIEGISLIADVPKEEPEDKLRSETTITRTVTEAFIPEEEDEGRFRGSDVSRPYKSPEMEGISLVSDISKTEEPDEGKLRSGTTVTIIGEKTLKEKTEDIGRFRGSTDISHPYKTPEMEGLTLVTEEKPAEKSDVTVNVTKTTTVVDAPEEPADESDEEWFESNEDTTRTDVVTTTEIDEKEKDQLTDVTVTVKKTVTTTIIDGEPRQRPGKTEVEIPYKVEEQEPSEDEVPTLPKDVERNRTEVTTVVDVPVKKGEAEPKPKAPEDTSNMTVTVKKTTTTTVIDSDKPEKYVPSKDDKQPRETTDTDVSTVRTVTTKTVSQEERPDENITLTTDTALITNISQEITPKKDEVDQGKPKEDSDDEWFESSEHATRRTRVTKTVTTTKGGKIKSEQPKRRKSQDILGDDEWSDSDEMPTKTETITTTVTTIKDDDKGTTDQTQVTVVDKPAKLIDSKEKDDEGWSDSYSTTRTVRTVVTSLEGDDKPDHQAFGDKTGKVQGDQEWSDSSEFTTKTQAVTTVVTKTSDSHEFGEQRVSTISAEMGVGGEGTEAMGETTEVTQRTTIVERNKDIVSGSQVSSTIFLHVHVQCQNCDRFSGVAQKQNCRTFRIFLSIVHDS